jgi:DNA-binding sugar fermentation-stimulating protein
MNRLRAGLPRNCYLIPSAFKYIRFLKGMQTNSGYDPTVIIVNQGSFGGVNKPGRGTVCSSQFTSEAKNERTSISSMRHNGHIYLSNSVRASIFSVEIFNTVVPKTGRTTFSYRNSATRPLQFQNHVEDEQTLLFLMASNSPLR